MSDGDSITRKIFLDRVVQGVAGLALTGAGIGEAAAIDLSTLPQRLIPVGVLEHGIRQVRGIDYGPDGQLIVVGKTGLARFKRSGEQISALALDNPGMAVAADEEGFSYVAERTRIHKVDPQGEIAASWGEKGKERGQIQYATGLAVAGASLYVADAGNRRVHRFAIDGDFVDELEGFHIPSAYFDCSADSKGRLYVGHTSEHRVESYDRNGEKVGSWGSYSAAPEGFCGCCNPTNLAAFPDGRIATTEKGIPRLKVYDSAGTLLAFLSSEELGVPVNRMFLEQAAGSDGTLPCHDGWPGMPVAVGPNETLAVAVSGSGKIRFYRLAEV